MKQLLTACPGSYEVSREWLILRLNDLHTSLSTSLWNGGIKPVQYILDQKLTDFYPSDSDFPGGSVLSFLRLSLLSRGADPERGSVLLTSAKIEKYSHRVYHYDSLIIETFTTGGCEATACRAGEPPFYEETDHGFVPAGTFNIFCLINGRLCPGAMARALITLTEGKTAALQDAGVFDVYRGSSATGTATDGVTLIINDRGPTYTDAGTFSVLGSLLAQSARDTVADCLAGEPNWNESDDMKTPHPVQPDLYKNR